ncbi:MAG TPA: hypothetical protein PK892_12560 [Bacteroidales bacterium]|nr:hypothetical protein [Bacteroidales bacterium]
MTIFTKEITTPREVDNIYQEFENLFSETIRSVESDWDDKKHSMVDYTLEYIIDKRLFEDHYVFLINEIKKHILEQLSTYNTIQLISFVEKQRINFKLFTPELRKRHLYNDYLVMNIAMGDESILKQNYKLSDYQSSMVRHAYKTHSDAYCALGNEMEALFTSFFTIIQKSDVHNSQIEEAQHVHVAPQIKPELYKRHPKGLDLFCFSTEILEAHRVFCEYRYLEINGYGEIPVPVFALLGVEHHKLTIPDKCFIAYAKGFIDGYQDSLVPFIDNPTSRKEKIIYEAIGKGGKGFCQHQGRGPDVFNTQDFLESGIFEGKRYKAWSYIFEAPSQFMDFFNRDKKKAPAEKIHADKWYALYHLILIAIGKQDKKTISGTKEETILFGKNQYQTGQGFYRIIKDLDLNNMVAFVRSLPKKDINKWKTIIRELSNNDADVISWLNKQPNK